MPIRPCLPMRRQINFGQTVWRTNPRNPIFPDLKQSLYSSLSLYVQRSGLSSLCMTWMGNDHKSLQLQLQGWKYHNMTKLGSSRTPGDELAKNFRGKTRVRSIHRVGMVGKVQWRDLGGHPYSGIFKGAKHGLAR